jgi:hypothetical protein
MLNMHKMKSLLFEVVRGLYSSIVDQGASQCVGKKSSIASEMACVRLEEAVMIRAQYTAQPAVLGRMNQSSGVVYPSLSNGVVLSSRFTLGYWINLHSLNYSSYPQRNASSFRDRLVLVYGAMGRRFDLVHGGLGEWLLIGRLANFLVGGHRTSAAWGRLM